MNLPESPHFYVFDEETKTIRGEYGLKLGPSVLRDLIAAAEAQIVAAEADREKFIFENMMIYFAQVLKMCPGIDQPGYVYIARHEDNSLKIGFSKKPASRVRHQKLDLIVFYPGTLAHEQALHRFFAQKHVRGEFFNLNGEDVKLIKKILES